MSKKISALLLLGFLLISSGLYAQEENIYRFFMGKLDFSFLKNIEVRILQARKQKDGERLCIYAAMLFYTERVAGKKHSITKAESLLNEGTGIAWRAEDIKALKVAKAVWRSKMFGPYKKDAAKAIRDEIRRLKKLQKKTQKPIEKQTPTKSHDPQAILQAEEYARVSAVEQLAESVFGVMVKSLSEVEDFQLKKDVVITKLKTHIITGAIFGETKIEGDEIHVPVVISREAVIASIERTMLSEGKKMDAAEKKKLEKTLRSKYKSVGIGAISK